MTEFILLTAEDCHLCDHGKNVLNELAGEGLLSWREVEASSGEGQRLEAVAPPLRPVLYASDARVIAYGRLSLKRLRKQLAREQAAA